MNSVAQPVRVPPVEKMPVSERVRARLEAAGQRYHANDNIGEFLEGTELDELQEEVREKLQEVLKSLVIDWESNHNTQDTAKRVAKMFVREVFSGRYTEEPATTEFPNVSRLDELISWLVHCVFRCVWTDELKQYFIEVD